METPRHSAICAQMSTQRHPVSKDGLNALSLLHGAQETGGERAADERIDLLDLI